ncbi:MAG: LptE family protein [Acidobacteriota bacterium]
MRKFSYLIIVLPVIFLYSCGYKVSGSGKYIPQDLKKIAIPDFENRTTRYQAEQFVTFAIRDEFIKKSSMILVEKISDADALLEGEIVKFDVKPLAYSSLGSVNQYTVLIYLNVRLLNLRNNEIIYEKKSMSFVENYEIGTADFFSQETESLQKIAKKFSSGVVSAILENF